MEVSVKEYLASSVGSKVHRTIAGHWAIHVGQDSYSIAYTEREATGMLTSYGGTPHHCGDY